MRRLIQRFRDRDPEGVELWTWQSDYRVPNWEASVWLTFDKWGLGIETELDKGSAFYTSERRRFFAVMLGPLSFVLMRTSAVR